MKKLLLAACSAVAALFTVSADEVRLALVGGTDAVAPSAKVAISQWEEKVPCTVDSYALAAPAEGCDILSQMTRVFAAKKDYNVIAVWASEGLVPGATKEERAENFRKAIQLVREKSPTCSLLLFTPYATPLNAKVNAAHKELTAELKAVGAKHSVSILDMTTEVPFPEADCAAYFVADGAELSEKGAALVGEWQAKLIRFIHSMGWGTDPGSTKAAKQKSLERMAKRTQRFHDAKWGVFNHFLGSNIQSAQEWADKVNAFDVKKVADQLEACGANYYFITIMQGRKWMCAPNATFDRIAGTKPGEACAVRDLPMELSEELSKRGIDLYLYFTGDGPYIDRDIGSRFGFTEPRYAGVTKPFVEKWASVLEEFAVRYGDRVKGWWIDGCYAGFFGYTDDLLSFYRAAVSKGNPDAIAAFANGVRPYYERYTELGDFTAGEFNDSYCVPKERFVEGAQAHALIPLGAWIPGVSASFTWCKPGAKRSADYVADYVKLVNENGGVVTIDVAVANDGSWRPEQMEVLKAVGHATGTLKRK